MQYCLYLRKSRADSEAEALGEGETLARHEKALLDLAKKLNLNITAIYREIVSGETIAARPVMQQLLQEVEQGIWDGVLVMEVERLARGDTIDQGIVAQTFKFSDTKIITPIKTYNPNNEFDEEYFEFGLFMSRREYKTINRRLQRGRMASVKDGKYVANKAPYGYNRIRIENDKGWTLEINKEEADVVRLIFELYTVGEKQSDNTFNRLGTGFIAKRLNTMKVSPKRGKVWVVASIRDILINPVYIGMIRWNWRPQQKKMIDGQLHISRPRATDYVLCNGLHPPIISKETFDMAQELMRHNPARPIGEKNTVKISWDITSPPVERISQVSIKKKALQKEQHELDTLNKQISKTHDLLEQGIYTTDVFLERSRALSLRMDEVKEHIAILDKELKTEITREDSAVNIIPKVEKLLEVYHDLPSPKAKNDMLKDVLEKVVYTKKERSKKGNLDNFNITIYPKIPKYIT